MKYSSFSIFLCLRLASAHRALSFLTSATQMRSRTANSPLLPYTRSPIERSFILGVTEKAQQGVLGDGDDDEDEEPGKMRVSELKAELDLRAVDYSDCIDKESLSAKLLRARTTGKASPAIIDDFNKKMLDENPMEDLNEADFQQVVGGDGTLPGGLPPDMLKKLMSNPELVSLLQSPKMQEAMKLMMTGGQSALEKAMEEDSDIFEVVTKLNETMEKPKS